MGIKSITKMLVYQRKVVVVLVLVDCVVQHSLPFLCLCPFYYRIHLQVIIISNPSLKDIFKRTNSNSFKTV